jgi:hypothetical protein
MPDEKIQFVVTGEGFYREHNTFDECKHWADYYGNQGKKNISITKVTTLREVLFPEAPRPPPGPIRKCEGLFNRDWCSYRGMTDGYADLCAKCQADYHEEPSAYK